MDHRRQMWLESLGRDAEAYAEAAEAFDATDAEEYWEDWRTKRGAMSRARQDLLANARSVPKQR